MNNIKKVGRPRLAKTDKKKSISFRFSQETIEKIREIKERDNLKSATAAIELAINEMVSI